MKLKVFIIWLLWRLIGFLNYDVSHLRLTNWIHNWWLGARARLLILNCWNHNLAQLLAHWTTLPSGRVASGRPGYIFYLPLGLSKERFIPHLRRLLDNLNLRGYLSHAPILIQCFTAFILLAFFTAELVVVLLLSLSTLLCMIIVLDELLHIILPRNWNLPPTLSHLPSASLLFITKPRTLCIIQNNLIVRMVWHIHDVGHVQHVAAGGQHV